MKIKKRYIILLILLLLLESVAIIGVWNLKLGDTSGFLIAITALMLSLLTIVIYILLLFEIIPERYLIIKNKKNQKAPQKIIKDDNQVQREFIDPKHIAEQIFKNVLLKRNLSSFGEKLLHNLTSEFNGMQAVFYLFTEEENVFNPISYYAMVSSNEIKSFSPGEGIVGQATMDEKITVLSNLPSKYRSIHSGLGKGEPSYIYFIPFYSDKNCIAIIELSTFKEISGSRLTSLNYLIKLGAKKLTQFREKIDE